MPDEKKHLFNPPALTPFGKAMHADNQQRAEARAKGVDPARDRRLQEIDKEKKRLTALLNRHFIGNCYVVEILVDSITLNRPPYIQIKEKANNLPNDAAQKRFKVFFTDGLAEKYAVSMSEGEPKWVLHEIDKGDSFGLLTVFRESFSPALQSYINSEVKPAQSALSQDAKLGDTHSSIISASIPKIPVALPNEEGNMYDLIDLLKLCPDRDGYRYSPATRTPFKLDQILPQQSSLDELTKRHEILNHVEARYGVKPVCISKQEKGFIVTLSDESTMTVTEKSLARMKLENEAILRSFQEETIPDYEKHLASCKSRYLSLFLLLSDSNYKQIQLALFKQNMQSPTLKAKDSAEQIIALRKHLVEKSNFGDRRDGWITYFLKCLATFCSVGVAHYRGHIFESHGEAVIKKIQKPTAPKV